MTTHAPGPKEVALRALRDGKTTPPAETRKLLKQAAARGLPRTPRASAPANPAVEPAKMETVMDANTETETTTSTPPSKPARAKKAPSAKKTSKAKVPKKVKAAQKDAPKKAAKSPAKPKTAKPAKANGGVRPGSKLEIVAGLLTRSQGCTGAEILAATGWTAVSVPQQAKAAGLKLTKEKAKGEPIRYFGTGT